MISECLMSCEFLNVEFIILSSQAYLKWSALTRSHLAEIDAQPRLGAGQCFYLAAQAK